MGGGTIGTDVVEAAAHPLPPVTVMPSETEPLAPPVNVIDGVPPPAVIVPFEIVHA